jgi:hypothetical protein
VTYCRPIAVMALVALLLRTSAHATPPDSGKKEIAPGIDLPAKPMRNMLCARSFSRRGTFVLERNYSGAGGGFTFDQAGFLEIRHMTAWLHVPGTTGGNIGANTRGVFSWYDMEMRSGKADYSAAQDGAIYADSNSWVTVVVYRNDQLDQHVTGEYVLRGCLVDRIPQRLRRPDSQLPRLPPKVLTPLEPVERLKVLKLQEVDPGR